MILPPLAKTFASTWHGKFHVYGQYKLYFMNLKHLHRINAYNTQSLYKIISFYFMLLYSVIWTLILLKDIDQFYKKVAIRTSSNLGGKKESYMYQVVIDKLKSHLFG